ARRAKCGQAPASPRPMLSERRLFIMNLHGRICGRPLMASTIWCFERLGRLRSYVRPFGAERVSAGPDEVRQPGVTSRMRAARSCDGLGCSWSSVATVVIHHVFVALTKL